MSLGLSAHLGVLARLLCLSYTGPSLGSRTISDLVTKNYPKIMLDIGDR